MGRETMSVRKYYNNNVQQLACERAFSDHPRLAFGTGSPIFND